MRFLNHFFYLAVAEISFAKALSTPSPPHEHVHTHWGLSTPSSPREGSGTLPALHPRTRHGLVHTQLSIIRDSYLPGLRPSEFQTEPLVGTFFHVLLGNQWLYIPKLPLEVTQSPGETQLPPKPCHQKQVESAIPNVRSLNKKALSPLKGIYILLDKAPLWPYCSWSLPESIWATLEFSCVSLS